MIFYWAWSSKWYDHQSVRRVFTPNGNWQIGNKCNERTYEDGEIDGRNHFPNQYLQQGMDFILNLSVCCIYQNELNILYGELNEENVWCEKGKTQGSKIFYKKQSIVTDWELSIYVFIT